MKERGAPDILGRGLDDALKRIFRPRASVLDIYNRNRRYLRGRIAINVPPRYPERD
jgi:hypothetical protein